jgi:hypothetical protein
VIMPPAQRSQKQHRHTCTSARKGEWPYKTDRSCVHRWQHTANREAQLATCYRGSVGIEGRGAHCSPEVATEQLQDACARGIVHSNDAQRRRHAFKHYVSFVATRWITPWRVMAQPNVSHCKYKFSCQHRRRHTFQRANTCTHPRTYQDDHTRNQTATRCRCPWECWTRSRQPRQDTRAAYKQRWRRQEESCARTQCPICADAESPAGRCAQRARLQDEGRSS